tara:strand:- start:21 stop:206 length:186 start_codon:yes stop_codon:yes gene_type:complete
VAAVEAVVTPVVLVVLLAQVEEALVQILHQIPHQEQQTLEEELVVEGLTGMAELILMVDQV